VPDVAPPVVCTPTIAGLEQDDVVAVAPFADTWFFVVDDFVALDETRTVAVGRHGDFLVDGLFLIAFDGSGGVQWSTLLSAGEVVPWLVRLERVDDQVWVIGLDGSNVAVWRYALDGVESVATTIADAWVEQWTPTPSGGLLLGGRTGWGPDSTSVFVELTTDGEELWRGGEDIAAFDHAWGDGPIRRLDGARLLWEHDPRAEPFAGFPIDVGVHWARLHDSGEVAAVATLTGEGGLVTAALRIDASGTPLWSDIRPRVTISAVHPRGDGSIELRGERRECWPLPWVALLDATGDTTFEAQLVDGGGGRFGAFGLDGSDRPISIVATGEAIEWRTLREVQR